MKVVERIPFVQIPSVPQMIKDFLNGEIPGAEEFLFSADHVRAAIERKKSFPVAKRKILADELQRQLSGLALSPAQEENLASLSRENCFTVTTGHQLNFFTGPAFFIYKILQTVKTAQFLKAEFPDYSFVPVFWMATEDHDFEEINHFKTEKNYYEFSGKSGGAVGRIVPEMGSSVADFEQEFRDTVFGTELILMMKDCYKAGNTLAQAMRKLVHFLFSEFGLMIIDGDAKALKEQMRGIFKDEILGLTLSKSTENTVTNFIEKYGKVQVNPREINLFYLTETRNRIFAKGDLYVPADTPFAFTREEILRELENFPEKFSPNALMRPVYQETVLPNIAYIGGNAEIMYWLELTAYFTEIKLPFPILVPRNSMLFLSKKTTEKIEKNGLQYRSFFKDFSRVINEKIIENQEIDGLLSQLGEQLAFTFERLKKEAAKTEKSFGNLVEAEQIRQKKSFEKMQKRLLRAEKVKHHEKVQQLQNLFLEVNPRGNWQERVLNFSVFFANGGISWLQDCYDEMDVENSQLIITQI